MIKLVNVSKSYGNFPAVRDISFNVEPGVLCILIGPSGCGKSTTLKMINRMLEADKGEIYIGGENIKNFKPTLLRRKIGYVIQNIGLFPHMDVYHNIAVVPSLLKWEKREIERRVEYLLELIGLPPQVYKNKYPRELSGGEAQRIGVARALAADPPILLMDEPFGAVDPLTREILQVEFLKIQKKLKKTVILVTHDLDEAIKLGDKIIIMKGGEIVQIDTPENILSHPANNFVRNFVGTDRAIKKLARFKVQQYMIKPNLLSIKKLRESTNPAAQITGRFLWVTDSKNRLIGWLDKQSLEGANPIEETITRVDSKNFALKKEFTLKEALSRMLSQGVRSLPVTNEQDELIGEITLTTIEQLTETEE